jgi:hypothetical protein
VTPLAPVQAKEDLLSSPPANSRWKTPWGRRKEEGDVERGRGGKKKTEDWTETRKDWPAAEEGRRFVDGCLPRGKRRAK